VRPRFRGCGNLAVSALALGHKRLAAVSNTRIVILGIHPSRPTLAHWMLGVGARSCFVM
jgi:hypothetical protein